MRPLSFIQKVSKKLLLLLLSGNKRGLAKQKWFTKATLQGSDSWLHIYNCGVTEAALDLRSEDVGWVILGVGDNNYNKEDETLTRICRNMRAIPKRVSAKGSKDRLLAGWILLAWPEEKSRNQQSERVSCMPTVHEWHQGIRQGEGPDEKPCQLQPAASEDDSLLVWMMCH